MSNVLVGMCCGGAVEAQTIMSLLGLLTQEDVAFSLQIGGYKPHNMNKLVAEAKRLECTHLLSIDPDMVFPSDGLSKLLKHNKDIVGANYMARGTPETQHAPYSTVKFEKDGKYVQVEAKDFPKKLFECAAVGLGFTLIKLSVFDKFREPYFETTEPPFSTEDMVFCANAKHLGHKVYCDPTIQVGHIGKYVY